MLSLNLRTPGVLAEILQDVRSQRISDKSWAILQSRVLGVERDNGQLVKKYDAQNDPRLQRPPFSDNRLQYIVHRHIIRVAQSFHNALRSSTQSRRRLYAFFAADSVRTSETSLFTETMRREVLQIPNPRNCSYLPGVSQWYIGMKLLLFSKKCVRLGLMNGCQCTLEDIVFSEHEDLPMHYEVGDIIKLEYVPPALLLRADQATWVLPPTHLPPLPPEVDRRGLFVLRQHTGYFPYGKLHVKRTSYPLFDASVKIVYSAQGEQYRAMIADLAQPHDVTDEVFWLASYVMLSRAESLEGLLLSRLCPRSALEKGTPAYLLEEIDRLLLLERQSQQALQAYLTKHCTSMPGVVQQLFRCVDLLKFELQEATTKHSLEDFAVIPQDFPSVADHSTDTLYETVLDNITGCSSGLAQVSSIGAQTVHNGFSGGASHGSDRVVAPPLWVAPAVPGLSGNASHGFATLRC